MQRAQEFMLGTIRTLDVEKDSIPNVKEKLTLI